MEQHWKLAKLVVIEAFANLTLSLILGFFIGGLGVALASVAACCIIHVPSRMLLVKKCLPDITLVGFVKCVGRPAICTTTFFPVLYYLKNSHTATTWSSLVLAGGCLTLFWLPIAFTIGLNKQEQVSIKKAVLRLVSSNA